MRSIRSIFLHRLSSVLPVLALVSLVCLPAVAMDKFEIQVYQGEHNDPGQASSELHTNYTMVGHQTAAYPGETPPDGVLRFTLEPALGITHWLELGAYLQTMISPDHGMQWGGWKLRAKVIAPESLRLPLVLGINVELGRVPTSVEEEGWANEFRPIIGMLLGRVRLTANPLFGFALTGPEAGKPDFEPAGKVAWNTNLGFAVGLEHYSALGRFDQGFVGMRRQEHVTFAVFDLVPREGQLEGPWELNVALGRSWTDVTPQRWLIKAIVGHAF